MTVVDTKSWQGGRITETMHSMPADMLTTSIITQPRRNVGGRRPNKDKSVSTMFWHIYNRATYVVAFTRKENVWVRF